MKTEIFIITQGDYNNTIKCVSVQEFMAETHHADDVFYTLVNQKGAVEVIYDGNWRYASFKIADVIKAKEREYRNAIKSLRIELQDLKDLKERY